LKQKGLKQAEKKKGGQGIYKLDGKPAKTRIEVAMYTDRLTLRSSTYSRSNWDRKRSRFLPMFPTLVNRHGESKFERIIYLQSRISLNLFR
jgi:hypothetical protein